MSIFKIIQYIFVGLIAAVALLLVISTFPITGNFQVLTVLSGSMEPDIRTGSIVVIKPVESYKIGDVITFGNNKETPTTHRIENMEVTEGRVLYTTKGDANNAPDAKTVMEKDIIGKVLFTVPFVGYAVDVVKKPIGFMLIIIIPAVIIVYDEIRKVRKEIVNMRSKKKDEEQNNRIQENFEANKRQEEKITDNYQRNEVQTADIRSNREKVNLTKEDIKKNKEEIEEIRKDLEEFKIK